MLTDVERKRGNAELRRLLEQLGTQITPDEDALQAWFADYRHHHLDRLARDLEMLEANVPAPAKVLEYGAIPLLLTAALQTRSYQVTGLDIGPQRFADAIRGMALDVRQCDVERETTPFEAASFDAVLFNELFEHLRINPIFTLREVHRILKPQGRLFISTPNLRSAKGIRNLLFKNQGHAVSAGVYRQYEKLETLGHMGHVREYTTKEVVDFLQHIGFEVEKVIYRGGDGAGLTGLVERVVPSMRPFFSLIARKREDG